MEGEGLPKVALVTGANSGLGYALCDKLLQSYPGIKLCLCCRNKKSAQLAASQLQKSHPLSELSIILLDTASVKSVKSAAAEVKKKFDHIDLLYLNAGTFKVTGVDWSLFFKNFFTSKLPNMLKTGENMLIHQDDVTADGLKEVFQTNVFGHYILVQELELLLQQANEMNQQPAQIIWTSSRNASRSNFCIDDIQHKEGKEPYSSSKYAINMMSVGLNERLNSKNVYSHVVLLGLMNTKMVQQTLSAVFWMIMLPFLFLMRLFVSSLTLSPENGSKASFWLSQQDPASLSPRAMFKSCCSPLGKPYVITTKMEITTEDSKHLLDQLDELHDSFKDARLGGGL